MKLHKFYVYYQAVEDRLFAVIKSMNISMFKHFDYEYIVLNDESTFNVITFESNSESYDRPNCFYIGEL